LNAEDPTSSPGNAPSASQAPTSEGLSRREKWELGLLFLLLLLFFGGFYLRSEALSPAQHYRYTLQLQHFREADSGINAEILSTHMQLSRSYDALNRYLDQARHLGRELGDLPVFLDGADRTTMEAGVAALVRMLDDKARAVDDFKRANSVLKNSLAYFTAESGRFLDQRKDGAVKRAVEAYVRQVLYLAREPDAGHQERMEMAEQRMLEAVTRSVARPVAHNLSQHGRVIAVKAAEVDRLIREMLAMTSADHLHDVQRHYLTSHASAEAEAVRYRSLAYALALALALALGLTFVRLTRTRRHLARTNQELNLRYAALARAESRLRLHDAAFESAHEGMTLTDLEGTIIDVNPAFTRITGYERSEAIGRNPRVLKSGRHDRAFYDAMWKSIRETGNWRGEIWNRGKYGDIYPEILSISAVRDDQGEVKNYVAVFADISRLKEQEKQLSEMAYFDALTGLPNRVLLADRVAQALPLARRSGNLMAICYLDLDGFKPVNDTWGHEVGDQVLIAMAERFKAGLRGGDTVARLGGDEFVLLMLGLENVEEAEFAVRRVLNTISEPLLVTPEPISLSASIGITVYPLDDSDVDALLRHADQAMYRVKQSGKSGHLFYDPELDSASRDQDDQVGRVRAALDAGEFVLHYQPQVNLRTGQVLGVEALIRWQDPERGLLEPTRFLPLIQEHPIILQLGEWVLEQALGQADIWRAQGLDLTMSINVAGRHLEAPDFVQNLSEALARHPGNAGRLVLEVLETSALEDVTHVSRIIEECERLHVNVALDDFGTGYSSLTYLKRLPASRIKIDQTFVGEMLNDSSNLQLVEGVLGLARAFQRQVVAEGVETPEQGRVLLQIECDLAQGHAIARPMPAEDIPGWVRTWQPHPAWQEVAHLRWGDDLPPLLIAQVHHRNWLAQLMYSVKEHNMVPHRHVADPHRCHFGAWLDGIQEPALASGPGMAEIHDLHQDIHALAAAIDQDLRDGRIDAGRERLPALLDRHQNLLERLKTLELTIARPR